MVQEFVAGMMCSGFNTTEAEMEFIAASFDEDGEQCGGAGWTHLKIENKNTKT